MKYYILPDIYIESCTNRSHETRHDGPPSQGERWCLINCIPSPTWPQPMFPTLEMSLTLKVIRSTLIGGNWKASLHEALQTTLRKGTRRCPMTSSGEAKLGFHCFPIIRRCLYSWITFCHHRKRHKFPTCNMLWINCFDDRSLGNKLIYMWNSFSRSNGK